MTVKKSKFTGRLISVELESYTKPRVVESNMKKWVAYGENNDYFEFLADRYNGSPTHNAVITATTQMIYGLGIDARDKAQDMEGWLRVLALLSKEDLRKTAQDIKLNGNFAWQIITVENEGEKKLEAIVHIPVMAIRSGKAN